MGGGGGRGVRGEGKEGGRGLEGGGKEGGGSTQCILHERTRIELLRR